MRHSVSLLTVAALVLLAVACGGGGGNDREEGTATVTPPTRTRTPITGQLEPLGPTNIGQVWTNEGGDKVTRDELRAVDDSDSVGNSVWDGTGISLSGARNEVVSFNLVLEAPEADAADVTVTLDSLAGPDGAGITTRSASGDDLFNYVGRNIELFYVRYLEIKGLSVDLAYGEYDERHIPERCRRTYDESTGEGTGGWTDRPCHNKSYPDIAVPLELESPFTVTAGTNQSIWGDIYIPKSVPAGEYAGTISITENGALTWEIPISLRVRDFALPDLPSARTMVHFSHDDITKRYLGEDQEYPEAGTDDYRQALAIIDRHFQLAHRHKISLIGDLNDYTPIDQMDDAWTARLNGDLFTEDRGYDGVGVGAGNGVYSIGTYGQWPWSEDMQTTQADMWANSDDWVNWFDDQAFSTPTEYFLYLEDEPDSDRFQVLQQWAQWINDNPGPGERLKSLVTVPLPEVAAELPDLDIPTSGSEIGITSQWDSALEALRADPDKRFFVYNGKRPASGSFATEDDGVALRTLGWVQHKTEIDRWFYWTSTYYNNFQGNTGETNVFQTAHTFGDRDASDDDSLGESGWNHMNGDGVLLYPGTDTLYPDDSYGVEGPLASLRLKHWRRGIQDADYLAMAAEIDPARVREIVDQMVPTALWEYGVTDPEDPSYVLTDISWSTDPDDWEAARAELADIIEGGQ